MVYHSEVVSRNQDILGGMPVFNGTRVPAKTLLDYLQKGHSIDEFLDDFPTVRREQAHALLASFETLLVA